MRDKDLMDGLFILGMYRKSACNLDAQHDEIWVGITDTPIVEHDFNRMFKLGFDLDTIDYDEILERPTYETYLEQGTCANWHCYT